MLRTRLAWCLLIAWVGVTVCAVARMAPGMYSDPGWGVLAAEQMRIGRSGGLRTIVTADATDLRRDVAGTVSWWPPSYQAAPALFRWFGWSWGHSLKAATLIAWAAALAGWGLWFAAFVPRAELPWLLLCFAACRYAHAPFHLYEGEILALAVFPWLLWGNTLALSRPRLGPALAAPLGAATAAMFAVKYSLLLPALALALVWVAFGIRRRIPRAAMFAYVGAALACLWLQHGLGLPGGATPGSTHTALAPARVLEPFARLSLAGTDLDALLEFVLGHPSRAWLTPGWKTVIGFASLAPLMYATRRIGPAHVEVPPRFSAGPACVLALLVVVPSALGISLAWGAPIDDSARHVRGAALAALPWVWAMLARGLRASRIRAAASGVLLTVFFALPATYGAAALVDKAFRRAPRDTALVADHGVRLDLLAHDANAVAFYAELRRSTPNPDTVYYWTSPDLALSFADRRLLVDHADFVSTSDLARRSYRGCPASGAIVVVLPVHFASNGKEAIVQRSFANVSTWRLMPNAHAPAIRVWRGACAIAPPT